MLGAGIKTTAEVEIVLNLNKTAAWNSMKASVKELKASLNDLARTVGIEKGVKNYSALERELKKVQRELKKTKDESATMERVVDETGNEMIEMVQAAKGITYQFSTAGKVIGALAHEIDNTDKEVRGLDAAMDNLGKETKEEIALSKAYAAIFEEMQKDASKLTKTEAALAQERLAGGQAIKLGKAQEAHLVDFRKQQAKIAKDLERAESKRNKALKDAERELRRKAAAEKAANAEGMRAAAITNRAQKEEEDRARAMNTLIGRINHYERAMDAVFRASFRLKMVGSDLMFMARRALGALVTMMDEFGEFEFMLNRAAGALSVQSDMMDTLTTKVLDLSVAMRLFPAKDVAQALYFWGSTTGQVVKTEEDLARTMSALNPIMKAAAMTNTNYEDTIKGVYSILSQYYNGSVSMAASVTADLFYITQKTAAEFPDLIHSFKMVGPIAKANNVSFRDMVNLFGRLADLGVRGSMAGRAFRQMFIQMLRPSGPAIKAINQLFTAAQTGVKEFDGKSYFELMFPKGEFIGTEGYLKNLALAVRSLNAAERNSFLAKIATANELPVLTALVNDQIRALDGLTGAQDKNVQSSKTSAEYFEENWKKLSNSWKGVVGALKSTFEALKMQVADVMAEVLAPFVNQITEIVEKVREWAKAPENKALIEFLGKLVILGGAATAVAGAIFTVTGALLGLGAAMVIAIRAFKPFIPLIGGIITGVITLADAFIRNFDLIKETIDYAMTTISDSFNAAGVSMDDLTDVINSVTEPIRGMMDVIIKGATTAIRFLADLIAALNDLGVLMPMLKTFAGLMAAIFAARAITAILGMTKAIGGLSLGFFGVGKASKSVDVATGAIGRLKSMVGLGGLATIILGAGFVAYESNFLGFGGLIDSLTDGFRDLKKEIREVSSEFGQLSESASANAYKVASQRAEGVKVKSANTVGENAIMDWVDYSGQILDGYRVLFPDGEESSAMSSTEVDELISKWIDKRSIEILDRYKLALIEINRNVAMKIDNVAPYSPEDYQRIMNSLFKSMPGMGAEVSRAEAAALILENQAVGGLGAENQSAIAQMLIDRFHEFKDNTIDEVIKELNLGEQRSISAIRADQVKAARAAVYQPAIDALDKLIGSGASGEEIEKFLVMPFSEMLGNMEVDAAGALASVAGSNGPLDEAQMAIWQAALEIIGKPASDLDGIEQEFANILEAQWKPVTNMINDALTAQIESTMFDSMEMIDQNLKDIATQLPYSGIQGGAAKSATVFNDMIDTILENKLQLPQFASETIKSIGDYLAEKGAINVTDYSDMETALKLSMAESGEVAAEIVQKSFSDFVSAFTTGVDAVEGLKKALKDAGDRGSNVSQIGKMLAVSTQKWLTKALKSGNLQQMQIARQFMIDRDEAIAGALQAGGRGSDRRIAARVSRGKGFTIDMAQILVDNIDIKGTPLGIQKRILKKLGRFGGVKTLPSQEQIAGTMFGGGISGPLKGKKVAIDKGIDINVTANPNLTLNPIAQEKMNAVVDTSIKVPMQNAVDTMKVDASIAGSAAMTSFGVAALGDVQTIKDTYIQPAMNSITGSMGNETNTLAARGSGVKIGIAFGGGVNTALNNFRLGTGTYSLPAMLGSIETRMQTGEYWAAGTAVGNAWAGGLNEAIRAGVDSTVSFVASVTIGESPPPMGPLKNIDKGGANIGKAWAKGMTSGAEKQLGRGMRNVRRSLDSKGVGGSIGVETTINRKKEIDININVHGTGKVDQETQSQMRKAVYDALVDSEILDHYVTIS